MSEKPDRRHTLTILNELAWRVNEFCSANDQPDLEDAVNLLFDLAKDSPTLKSRRQDMLAILASDDDFSKSVDEAERYYAAVDQAIAEREAGTALH